MTAEERGVFESTTDWVMRMRCEDDGTTLTCKSRIDDDTALELEWVLSPGLEQQVLVHGPFPSILKTRYVWEGEDGFQWEVDEFEGAFAGLVLAEVELPASTTPVVLPTWLGHEITGLTAWSNHALATAVWSTLS